MMAKVFLTVFFVAYIALDCISRFDNMRANNLPEKLFIR